MSARLGATLTEAVDALLNTARDIPVEDREQLARLGADAAVLAARHAAGEQGIDSELEVVRVSVEQLTVAHESRVAQVALSGLLKLLTVALAVA